MLAATLVGVVDFFPVTFLYGVSKFLFTALALSFCISLLISFVVAMTVIPLFCSRFLKVVPHGSLEMASQPPLRTFPGGTDLTPFSTGASTRFSIGTKALVRRALNRPALTVVSLIGLFAVSLVIYPFLGVAFFPRTDAGQFTVNVKAPTGSRIEVSEQYVAKIENLDSKQGWV